MEIASQAELVCNKHDVELHIIKGERDTFRLHFKLKNDNYDLHQAVGFKLFELMGELNKDVVERLNLSMDSEQCMRMGMVLKRFGSEFGISQKYVCSSTTLEVVDDTYKFISRQIDKPDFVTVPHKCIPVRNSYSELSLSFTNNHCVDIVYEFTLEIEEDMPIMMRKLPGLLMKKIFIRLKTFLEALR